MKNPNPIVRARRLETRRKKMGYASRCFYCPESDPFCFEKDHPVTEKLDPLSMRTVCRNCHRKLEANRDIKGLTKNGLRNVSETEHEKDRRYHLLLAEDLDSIAEVVQSPSASSELIASALREAAASLRRTALTVWLSQPLTAGLFVSGPTNTDSDLQQSE
jgi:hypothetical protein